MIIEELADGLGYAKKPVNRIWLVWHGRVLEVNLIVLEKLINNKEPDY